MDPYTYLSTDDALQRSVMEAIAVRYNELLFEQHESLARMIRNEVVKGFSG